MFQSSGWLERDKIVVVEWWLCWVLSVVPEVE